MMTTMMMMMMMRTMTSDCFDVVMMVRLIGVNVNLSQVTKRGRGLDRFDEVSCGYCEEPNASDDKLVALLDIMMVMMVIFYKPGSFHDEWVALTLMTMICDDDDCDDD